MVLCLFRAIQQHLFGPSRMPCVWKARWEVLPSKSEEFAGLVVKVIQSPPANAQSATGRV